MHCNPKNTNGNTNKFILLSKNKKKLKKDIFNKDCSEQSTTDQNTKLWYHCHKHFQKLLKTVCNILAQK